MSSSEKKYQANRENAKRSTGPRSDVGKRRASLNALGWRLYSKTALLPGESESALRRLHKWVMDRWAPVDDGDKEFVDQIVNARWRLRRLDHSEQCCLEHFQKKQACSIDPSITIIGGIKVELTREAKDILDRSAEDAEPSPKDLRRALRRLVEPENLDNMERVQRIRRQLLRDVRWLENELETRQAKRRRKTKKGSNEHGECEGSTR